MFAFVADAKDSDVAAFYTSQGFFPLAEDGRRIFAPMAEIAAQRQPQGLEATGRMNTL